MAADQLEPREMLASIVTIGDSWAGFIANGAPGSIANSGTGNAMQNVLNVVAPGHTVYNGSFYGGTAAQHATSLGQIGDAINASGADIVYLSTGGNDMLAGQLLGGWWYNHPNPGGLYATIGSNIQTVVNYILNLRPDIQIVIASYDYPNVWDPDLSGTAGSSGNLIRDNLNLGAQGTPFGILDGAPVHPLVDIAGQAAFNAALRDVEQQKINIANASSRVHSVWNFNLLGALYGYNGYFGTLPAGLPASTYQDLPVRLSRLNNGNDPIHLDTTGYEVLALNAYNAFFNTALPNNASLSLNTTTLNFGNTRVGTSTNQAVTATNVGPNFTKVKDLTFAGASGDFSGGLQVFNPLFRDPLLGSDSAQKTYTYTPSARGGDNLNLGVTSSHGGATLVLSGNGVGPVYQSSTAAIDFGSIFVGAAPSEGFSLANVTTDGNLGGLTTLTVHSYSISGPGAGRYSLAGFTPGMTLAAGALVNLSVVFDGALGPPGSYQATLTFFTDQGAALGGAGQSFDIALAAELELGAPTADAGGPYFGSEGSPVALLGSGAGNITTWEWDLDNNGSFETLGQNVNFTAADNGVYTVVLRTSGPDGSATDSALVTISNVAPTAGIAGAGGYRGETLGFTLSASDPSAVDLADDFTYSIDWDGNGTVDQVVIGPASGTNVTHSFAASGSHSVKVRATDKDGGQGPVTTHQVAVTDYVLRNDGLGNIDLIWGGTPGVDAVFFGGAGSTVTIIAIVENNALANKVAQVSGVTGRVIAHGYAGSDVLVAELLVSRGARLYGHDGDDVLVGGLQGDLLDGGNGGDLLLGSTQLGNDADTLLGGAGDDVLVGMAGADLLDGGTGFDLLLGDAVVFPDLPSAVLAIHAEWSLSGHAYPERVANIRGIAPLGNRLNGDFFLQPNVTVFSDGAVDTLVGDADLDWFLYTFFQDLASDPAGGEEETDTSP